MIEPPYYQPEQPEQPSWLEWLFYNQRGIRSGWRLLAWFLLSLGGMIAVVLLIIALVFTGAVKMSAANQPPWWLELYSEWLLFAPIFIAALIVALTMEHRPISSLGLGFHSRWLREFVQGFALGAGLLSAVMLSLVCLGGYRIHGFNEGLIPALGWGVAMAVGFIGVGLFEEFFFRGYALQNLTDGIGFPTAAVISCLVFAAVHIPNPGENWIGILDVLVAGIQFLVLIRRTRSLWLAVGVHAAWDWAENFLYGVADSGIVLPGGLLRSSPHGPTWLSGGAAGPEGSIVALIIDILAVIYFARARWIRPSPDAAALSTRYVEHIEEPVVS